MFRVIVAGSRSFSDFQLAKAKLDFFLSRQEGIVILSGGARGADQIGERYAALRGYPVERFPAEWARFGHAAGPIRNREMAGQADAAVVFWDGISPGSRHLISVCQSRGLPLRIVRF